MDSLLIVYIRIKMGLEVGEIIIPLQNNRRKQGQMDREEEGCSSNGRAMMFGNYSPDFLFLDFPFLLYYTHYATMELLLTHHPTIFADSALFSRHTSSLWSETSL